MTFAELSMSCEGPLVSTAVDAGLPAACGSAPNALPAAYKPAMNPT
jgi:hypothetical protein